MTVPATMFDPMGSSAPPPPSFDAVSLPPQQQQQQQQNSSAPPPPAFDDVFSMSPPTMGTTPAPVPSSNLMWDPMAPAPDPTTTDNNNNNNNTDMTWTPQPPSAPSAPAYEDLLGFDQHPPPMPPPTTRQEFEAPPTQQAGLDEGTLQAILAMEGMSMAEKQAMIDEQERIMREIEEKNKPVSAADAFRQRSHAAAVQAIGGGGGGGSSTASRTVDIGNGHEVALRGQEQTKKAIEDGTAVLAQCLSCENWMQVTGNATLMFCPTCQTVSPVLKADDSEAAAQLKADMELAQRLQNEEYNAAEQRNERRQERSSTSTSSPKKKGTAKASSSSSSSWWDYLGFGSGATAATGVAASPPSFAVKPPERGDMGVSRPPGSPSRRLEPAQTGEETIGFSPSYEDNGPLLGSGGGAAVVAPRQTSLFACVGDSITSAATQLTNALNTDEEGNVHGVDSSGLLAMPQVGRESQYRNMDDGRM